MPTYQYACTECAHAFEQHQSFTDDALTVCPQCQGRLRKVFNAVGVVFKGSGFYRTDSREKPASANGSSKDSKSDTTKPDKSSDSTKSDSSKSDSKPSSTAKSETKAAASA
ncbi:MAG TPA: FmdB family zinc ribbon protein [Nocardioidaceae bacterium]|nr:FmdB family zinc ribbon protein [Nocardioidaceae bacterium]